MAKLCQAEFHDGCFPKECRIAEIRRELLGISLDQRTGKYSQANEERRKVLARELVDLEQEEINHE